MSDGVARCNGSGLFAGGISYPANAIAQHGFSFFGLVDLTYYCGTFYQGDAIFIRDDIVASLDALRPMQVKPFDQSQWFPVSYKVLGV